MVRLCLPHHRFQTTLEGVRSFLFYVSNFPEKTFMYEKSHSETDHILVISWHLLGQTINLFPLFPIILVLNKLKQKCFNPDQHQNNCWPARRSSTRIFLSKGFHDLVDTGTPFMYCHTIRQKKCVSTHGSDKMRSDQSIKTVSNLLKKRYD